MDTELNAYEPSFLEQAKTAIANVIVESTETEQTAADFLAKCELVLRDVEAKRVEVTKPLNDALKAVNARAKVDAKPWEELKDIVASSLTEWRSDPATLEFLKERNQLEADLKRAEVKGDITEMTAIKENYDKALAVLPKSVCTSTEATIQYRSSVEITELDGNELHDCYTVKALDVEKLSEAIEAGVVEIPDIYWTRKPDEKKIKDAIKEGETIRGVKARLTYSPVVVVRK